MQPGNIYFLKKSGLVGDSYHKQLSISASDVAELQWSVDESVSRIKAEGLKLAKYLKDRYLTIDVFDAERKFFYGSCKLPLYEVMRQGKSYVSRPKECEVFNPENN